MIPKKFTVGTTVRISAEMRDSSNVLTDVSSAVVYVTDPDGTVKVSAGVMSKESTGKYYYNWQSAESDDKGMYKVKVKATAADGYISIKTIELMAMREVVDA